MLLSNKALMWANPLIETEDECLNNWEAFISAMGQVFDDPNRGATAEAAMLALRQAKESVSRTTREPEPEPMRVDSLQRRIEWISPTLQVKLRPCPGLAQLFISPQTTVGQFPKINALKGYVCHIDEKFAKDEIPIRGLPWLQAQNPTINWETKELHFPEKQIGPEVAVCAVPQGSSKLSELPAMHHDANIFRSALQFCTHYYHCPRLGSQSRIPIKEHHEHVKLVLERLQQNHLYIKLEKCEFHQTEIQFLGYVMSSRGICKDESKTQAIKNWRVVKNVKEVQRFIGFANFYRCFIRNFSVVVSPITQLTRKRSIFTWTPQAQEAFSHLKSKFTTAPILVHPNPELAFIRLSAAEKNYDVGNRELLAIISAFKEWRHHLQGTAQQIVILTDHRNLEFIRSAKCLTPRQARWSLFLNQFNFIISYRPGSCNGKADALSRIHSTETSPLTTSKTILPDSRFLGVIHNQDLPNDIKEAYHSDSFLAQPPRDTNGQTERTNQTLEQYLRCFICHLQDDWVDLLPLAEFSYNNAQSASTKQSPFYANLENLESVQEKYKRAADKFRKSAPAFKDLVWLSTKNIKLRIPSSKLGHKYIGPYRINKIVSAVACRLRLPRTMRIHPVFHVSLLKAAVPNMFPGRSSPHPDPVLIDGQEEFVVEKILDSRLHRNQLQYLIKWQGYSVEDNSWEPVDNIDAPRLLCQFHQRYPDKPCLGSSGGCPSKRGVMQRAPHTLLCVIAPSDLNSQSGETPGRWSDAGKMERHPAAGTRTDPAQAFPAPRDPLVTGPCIAVSRDDDVAVSRDRCVIILRDRNALLGLERREDHR
ncbi:unnamed protein product [Ranitomeya imitator]|uniref:Chromo domain-containing protein n=1 Tax=Ranitomeya imitator TaxID=111125 RepID=A0ABN9KQY4_9NEOB|nr:unnamed protein product [Ranitomeya imitator]